MTAVTNAYGCVVEGDTHRLPGSRDRMTQEEANRAEARLAGRGFDVRQFRNRSTGLVVLAVRTPARNPNREGGW